MDLLETILIEKARFLKLLYAVQLTHLDIYLPSSYRSVKSLTRIFIGKIIAKAWLKISCRADV